jgi:hypothetical protein
VPHRLRCVSRRPRWRGSGINGCSNSMSCWSFGSGVLPGTSSSLTKRFSHSPSALLHVRDRTPSSSRYRCGSRYPATMGNVVRHHAPVGRRNDQHPGLGRGGLDEHNLQTGAVTTSDRPPRGPCLVVGRRDPRPPSSGSSWPRYGVNATRSKSLCGLVQRTTRNSTAAPPLNHVGTATLLSGWRMPRISAGWMLT